MEPEFEAWLNTRPPKIRILATAYPPGSYRIKAGAPYGVSCPGTKVELVGYTDSGQLIVTVTKENRLPEGTAHLEALIKQYNRPRSLLDQSFSLHVDPEWVEEI